MTVHELFSRGGIRGIGVDAIAGAAGVSKASIYTTFESKDDLIAAYIAEHDRQFWTWWDRL
ncbi:TetR/AcrR family transcriptional regulator [Mesorhizobium sp. B2-1-8]|uniref:TetR/AcrR family transcriptional regulator n=1 Tax=Mesorhizobium sp. B2-1-8 TaxID=2589967 RepID=UPI0015E3D0AA|nr:TetR/AcrR family transcriptional regulator [Mesorhizobium sp. B2-1-8]